MNGFVDDIEGITEKNRDFRRVVFTGKHMQLVLMSLRKGEEIGEEVHEGHDQFIRIEKGRAEVVIDGETHKVRADDAVIIPAGARHNVINTGNKRLKLYTLYGPPEHEDGLVQRRKDKAGREENSEEATTRE